ncbi:MAG: aminotransferase class I/II-fold pyridoxal phosphate-dependent enzyme [Alphaproteobacteria bacterium]|nr:aminotransferase class I/II-fold pyridoxal phosphate-dependent enzyme [Alphaproteobacteria bacterium]
MARAFAAGGSAANYLERGNRLKREVDPYIPGLTRAQAAAAAGVAPAQVVKLSSNENPLGPSPEALAAVHAQMGMIHEYPSPMADELRAAIGELHGVYADQVVVGAGSSSLMHAIVEAFTMPGGEVISMHLGFSVYSEIAIIHGRNPVLIDLPEPNFAVDLAKLKKLINPNTQLIFLTRPNNPTSTLVPRADFEAAARMAAEVGALCVSDEAYIEFADVPDCSAIPLVRGAKPAMPNVMVTRTFSKAYGLANLRLGYAIATPEVAHCLRLANAKWPTGQVAQAAGVAAIKDKAHLQLTLDTVAAGRKRLAQGFAQLGLPVAPSPQGNYIMVDIGPSGMDAASFTKRILELGAVVIRGDFSPKHVRISIGKPDENDRLLAAATTIMEKKGK